MGEPVRCSLPEKRHLVFEKSVLELWFNQMGKVCPITGDLMAMTDCKRDKQLEFIKCKNVWVWKIPGFVLHILYGP